MPAELDGKTFGQAAVANQNPSTPHRCDGAMAYMRIEHILRNNNLFEALVGNLT
jgi:hypothetical protein